MDHFVARYGPHVLAAPPPRGSNFLVWISPAAATVAEVAALAAGLRAWFGRQGRAKVNAPAITPDELPSENAARVERELTARSR